MKRKVGKCHGRLRRDGSYRVRHGSSLCTASHSGSEDTGQVILQPRSERNQTRRPNPVDSVDVTFCERQTCSCRHTSGPWAWAREGVDSRGHDFPIYILHSNKAALKLLYNKRRVQHCDECHVELATMEAPSRQLAWSEQGGFPGELMLS